MTTQVPWAGACVFCRRGIQREADGLFWADAVRLLELVERR